jgi:hypothetical protein
VKTALTFVGALLFWFVYFQFMDWLFMNKAQGLDYLIISLCSDGNFAVWKGAAQLLNFLDKECWIC